LEGDGKASSYKEKRAVAVGNEIGSTFPDPSWINPFGKGKVGRLR
jgi:hypothetical protein